MNASGGPSEARLAPWSRSSLGGSRLDRGEYSTGQAKAGASADSAEEMKDTPGVSPGRLHELTSVVWYLMIFPRVSG